MSPEGSCEWEFGLFCLSYMARRSCVRRFCYLLWLQALIDSCFVAPNRESGQIWGVLLCDSVLLLSLPSQTPAPATEAHCLQQGTDLMLRALRTCPWELVKSPSTSIVWQSFLSSPSKTLSTTRSPRAAGLLPALWPLA